jgi:hypothetical protein
MAKKKKLSGYYVFWLPPLGLYWGILGWDDFKACLIYNEEDIKTFNESMVNDPNLGYGKWITLEEAKEMEKENDNVSEI